jgi:hypothetical protein
MESTPPRRRSGGGAEPPSAKSFSAVRTSLGRRRLRNLEGASGPFDSPAASDGKTNILSESCKLTALRADADWQILAQNDLEDTCFSRPAIGDSRIYVRTRSARS